jgi:hypothetical protein
MSAFKLLIVEDNDQDLATCQATVARYRDEKQREVELIECRNIEEFRAKRDSSIDGAIIDLKLADQGDEGNHVIREIEESHFRIPVAVLTGTPGTVDSDFTYIGVFKKGDSGAGYADLLDRFWDIYNTGLTHIMGGRGIIEETLNKVFRKNLLPQIDQWVAYGKRDSSRTEKALLRHAMSHLLLFLDDDGECYFPEEVYIAPPLTDKIRTGSIVEQKSGGKRFTVMNPACDLVIRENDCKTDRFLLVEIEKKENVLSVALNNNPNKEKRKKKLRAVFCNNHTDYYHWLPDTGFFSGGFLNFRNILTVTKEEFGEMFQAPKIQISPSFVKDVIARFSSYYARQGQPNINCEYHIKSLVSS